MLSFRPLSLIGARPLFLCFVLWFGACKPAGQEPEQASGPPAITEVGQSIGPLATKTIGPAGGTLTSTDGRLTLAIPAGALSAETALTVEPVENTAPNGVGRGYHFGPEGTRFAKPASWTYHYQPGEFNGVGPVAIAVQQPDRSWVLTQGARQDTANRTITTQIRHFSWWSLVTQYQLIPPADTMLINTKNNFEVQYTDYPGGFPKFDADGKDLLAPLGWILSAKPSVIKSITLNGQKSGGDAGRFQMLPGADKTVIEYTSPDKQPARNPVALTLELQLPGTGLFMLTSNIFIKPPITFQVEGREFKKIYGGASLLNSPQVGTWLQFIIHEQDSPNDKQHNITVSVKKPTVGGFPFGEQVEVSGIFPSQKHTGYVHSWVETDDSKQYANGKVIITNIDRKNKLLEGSISGSLVYHNQPTPDYPRIHDIARFSATFSLPLTE
ncbi:hypothetical protein ACS5NO_24470 [Larkinella sp. GY13]|uniref:hypothetical protein n=1 Tax=Larkinella sp. GY13 TaxID=3453720 RepID=UPI003EE880E9